VREASRFVFVVCLKEQKSYKPRSLPEFHDCHLSKITQ